MARELSVPALRSVLAQHTSEIWLELVSFQLADDTIVGRWVKDTVEVVSRNHTYVPSFWEMSLANSEPGELPEVRFRIDNVSRELIDELRTVTQRIRIIHEIILRSSPDIVEVGPLNYMLRSVTYDANFIEGVLGYEDLLSESFPQHTFTPARFPGLF